MATMNVYVVTLEETRIEQVDYETKETETVTEMDVTNVFGSLEQVCDCLVDYGYEYNPTDRSFILPVFDYTQEDRFMRVYVFDVYSGEYVDELSPKDLFGQE